MNLSLLPVEPVASGDLPAPAVAGGESAADGDAAFLTAFREAQNRQQAAGKSGLGAGKAETVAGSSSDNPFENIGLNLNLDASGEAGSADPAVTDEEAGVSDAGTDAPVAEGDDAAWQALLAANAAPPATSSKTVGDSAGSPAGSNAAVASAGRQNGKDLPAKAQDQLAMLHDQSARRSPDVEAALQALEPLPADADPLPSVDTSMPGDDLLAFREALKQAMPGAQDGLLRRTGKTLNAGIAAELAGGQPRAEAGEVADVSGMPAEESAGLASARTAVANALNSSSATGATQAGALAAQASAKGAAATVAPVGVARTGTSVGTSAEAVAEISAEPSSQPVVNAAPPVGTAGKATAGGAGVSASAAASVAAQASADELPTRKTATGEEPELAADAGDELPTRAATTVSAGREAGQMPAVRSEAVAVAGTGPASGAELAAVLTTPATARADKTAPPTVPLALHVPHFDELLSNQVYWQASQKLQSAEIRLDPPELGPLAVRITQQGSETQIQFTVSHAQTREQLEQALPRLRELFESGGLQLTQVDVQDGRRGQPERREAADLPQFARGRGKDEAEPLAAAAERSRPLAKTYSLIDTYA